MSRRSGSGFWRTRVFLVLVTCGFAIGIFFWQTCQSITSVESYRSTVRRQNPASEYGKNLILGRVVGLLQNVSQNWSAAQNISGKPTKHCTMATCFDYSLCQKTSFKLFVYPEDKIVSSIYANMLIALRSSGYYTNNPEEACIFVLGLDTMDRDKLSDQFVHNINGKIRSDPLFQKHWNSGRNHIIFNLYAGTFPDYAEDDLGFDIGHAILAKASMSVQRFRKNFDISLPLFHNTLPVRGDNAVQKNTRFPESGKSYLLSFKGKRYLYGIGSDSRNSLYHIHNGRDIVIFTTCRHGKQAKELRDERCDQDDDEYDRYDYQMLLDNTTFCLVPRGRRLGSFRFLESLQAGCIPVILSNDWELPFSEIIDWKQAVLVADERLLTQIPSLVRSVEFSKIILYRQQAQILWRQYFSTIERIVLTSLEIIRNRLNPIRRSKELWNTFPALSMTHIPHLQISDSHDGFLKNINFPLHYMRQNFSVVITVSSAQGVGSTIVRMLKVLNRLEYVEKVIILTTSKDVMVQNLKSWTWLRIPVLPVHSGVPQLKNLLGKHIKTEAVLLLADNSALTTEHVEFGLHVWKSFPERIVGFHSASHFWDEASNEWRYSSKLTNDYSMVLLRDAFVHVQYYLLLWHYREMILPDLLAECSDILGNFISARITRLPPILLSGKGSTTVAQADVRLLMEVQRRRHDCVNELGTSFGFLPLVRSAVVYSPVLHKDNVSSYRKKYRQLENG